MNRTLQPVSLTNRPSAALPPAVRSFPNRPAVTAGSARAAAEDTLDALLRSERRIRRGVESRVAGDVIATGFAALDAALPGGGWRVGAVTELLVATSGIGELSLLLPALRTVTAAAGRWAALVQPPHLPYAPALASAGLALERLLVVETDGDGDALWAAEQLLRGGACAAVVLWVGRSDARRQRRLQLAAEQGAAWATVYRPAAARAEHSPVAARIALALADGRLALEPFKLRGGRTRRVTIDPAEFDEPQGAEWPLAPESGAASASRAFARAVDAKS